MISLLVSSWRLWFSLITMNCKNSAPKLQKQGPVAQDLSGPCCAVVVHLIYNNNNIK